MPLDNITLTDLRNHDGSQLSGASNFNLVLGENGAGKTNILEAISLFAPGRGLRRAPLTEIARVGGIGGFAIQADLTVDHSDAIRLATGTHPARPTRRLTHVNGALKPTNSLGEWLAISWLTPAMDGLFTDSAGSRRRFVDRMALAIDPSHARTASRYENALRERNRLMSEDHLPDPAWIEGLEVQMSESGAALHSGRTKLIERLNGRLATLPDEPFARPELALETAFPEDAAAFAKELANNRPADLRAGRTLIGPHRSDLLVTMKSKGVPAASCSTGEQKAMLIAITLAHAGLAKGQRPLILLLDEVAAHLDPVRRDVLFERLGESGAQVWITGTEAAPFETVVQTASCWTVADGVVTPS